jgi:hypothetical protein
MILVEVLLVLAVLTAIGWPIFVQPNTIADVAEDGDEYHKLIASKESAFVALKDLDFDHKTGKIDDEDYDQLKDRYETEAVSVMRRIDTLEKNPPPVESAETSEGVKTSARTGIFCTSCGTQAEAQDCFCRTCGSPLKK